MKSKLLKTMVLASSLAFFNCGEDAVTSAINNFGGGFSSSSAEEIQPGDASSSSVAQSQPGQGGAEASSSSTEGATQTDPTLGSSSSVATVPASSADVAASSSDAVSASSADVAPASSSSVVKVESSSSEKAPVVSSSSSEEKVESSSSAEAPKGIFLADGKDETKDQMRVKYIERTGHDGGGILAYPEQLSNDQKHAVVVWGPGGGTEPGAYGGMIRRLASHGFVVIALRESPGNASQGKPALDWLAKKNNDPNDPLYQKLDMNVVGCSGHSMGGLESEQMVIQDKRVITAMLNNSGDL